MTHPSLNPGGGAYFRDGLLVHSGTESRYPHSRRPLASGILPWHGPSGGRLRNASRRGDSGLRHGAGLQGLLCAITDLVGNTPPDRIRLLAGQIKVLSGPMQATKLSGWALTPSGRQRVSNLASAWKSSGISAVELAGMLLGASHAYHRAKNEGLAELVWTGPSSELVATRKTEQALLQVIQGAQRKLFLTSFVAYSLVSIMVALTAAADRGVAVSMLLESSDQHGGSVSTDAIGPMKKALPTADIYFWGNRPEEFAGGKVHAKIAVADERLCFISSANLTGHAMEKNMEAGVLISGGSIPLNLHRHLEALIATRVIARV